MTTPKPFSIKVSGQDLIVNPVLTGFHIYNRKSSFIAYIATKVVGDIGNQLFIQFNNGAGIIIPDLPREVIAKTVAAVSIGKFFHAELKDHYPVTDVENNCITVAVEEEDVPEGGDSEMFNDFDDVDI